MHVTSKTILERFGFEDSHPLSTPMDPNTSLPLLTEPEVDVTDYQSRVGSLIRAAVCSRFGHCSSSGRRCAPCFQTWSGSPQRGQSYFPLPARHFELCSCL